MRIVMRPAMTAVAMATRARFGSSPPPRYWPAPSVWVPMMSGFSTMM
jgi:hypothetical protein